MDESYSKPSALIIVDVQNDFISGSLAVAGGEQVAHDIVDYIQGGFRGWEHEFVVTTQDWHIDPGDHFSPTPDYVNSWPMHCVAGADGAELHPALKDINVDARFYKGTFSAAYSGFEGTTRRPEFPHVPIDLGQWLKERDVDEVDICGIATDYCVKATALDAVKAGFGTTLIVDLTAAVSPDGGAAAIDEMREAGVGLG